MEETTAEFAVSEIAPVVPLRFRPKVTISCKTDLGRVRENNEDKFEYFLPSTDAQLASRGMVFVCCDGMGGHAAGQIASELTCKTFIEVYLHHPSEDCSVAATSAAVAANRFVLDVARAIPDRRGMGTTLSVLIIVQDRAVVVQVGDSRVYCLRDGKLTRLTQDHTWVEEACRNGELTYEEAQNHPYQHVLTRAIGSDETLQPDVEWRDVQSGDLYLLCSDGLINHVTDSQIEKTLSESGPSEAAWKLVGMALADGGSDNCTVLIVQVNDLEEV